MYLVRTEYRKHDKSMYFRLKVQTFVSHTSTYMYVLSTYLFAYSCTYFSSFRKGTYLVHADSGGVCTLVPDSIARPPGSPPCLLASDSGTGPRMEPNHTQALADLFTAAWQHPCQFLSTWALALVDCWEIQLWRVSFNRFAATMISCLLTSSSSPSQQRSARCERACEGLGLPVGASMMSCKIFKQSCKVQVQRFYQRDKTKS
jgi:hypothetical protein